MSFKETDDPASGFVDSVSDPRFSTGYFQLRNRMAMLVETHSWKDYPTRVRVTHNSFVSVLEQVASTARNGSRPRPRPICARQRIAGQPVALTYKATDKTTMVDFQGYAYTRTLSDVSGILMTHYDESKPQVWHVPLRDEVVEDLRVNAPRAGYVVPAAFAQIVGAKLVQHGIKFSTLDKPVAAAPVETFRADKATFASISSNRTSA
jgi:hypothetical protein